MKYSKRVLLTAKEVALSWPTTMPYITKQVIDTACQFIGALIGLLLAVVMPFTFWAAPAWLWLFERRTANEKAKQMLAETMQRD